MSCWEVSASPGSSRSPGTHTAAFPQLQPGTSGTLPCPVTSSGDIIYPLGKYQQSELLLKVLFLRISHLKYLHLLPGKGVLHLADPVQEAKCISGHSMWVRGAEQLLHHIMSVWNMSIPEPGDANAETAFSSDTFFQIDFFLI